MRLGLVGLLLPCLPVVGFAQSNTINGLDAYMKIVNNAVAKGRTGTFPDGLNGISFDTTICNTGTVGIDWKGPMDTPHPFIEFLVARETNGRFVQISDRSYIKHTFAAANDSQCASCTDNSDSSVLAVGCSDTYSSNENGDRYWLAPPTEIDPWLCTWNPICSYFDRGDPPAAPPQDCDGIRSLTRSEVNAFDAVKNRVIVSDGDLNVSSSRYWYYGAYLVQGEADALREDTGGSHEFIPTWSGTNWVLTRKGSMVHGEILQNWTGAHFHSNANGNDDGRVYLASNVTGPDANGIYHYEYAIHNRDNVRAIGVLRIPFVPGASIQNTGFRDIDPDPSNDWKCRVEGGEVCWSTDTNPVEWNTIYNFWFDSDAPPAQGSRAVVREFWPGAGFDLMDVVTTAPLGPALGTNLGSSKAGSNGLAPNLAMAGSLDAGGSGDFMLRYAAPDSPALLFLADDLGGFAYRGGTIVPFPPDVLTLFVTDHDGRILLPFNGPGGNFDLFLQVVVVDAAAAGRVAMSNALEIVE